MNDLDAFAVCADAIERHGLKGAAIVCGLVALKSARVRSVFASVASWVWRKVRGGR